MSTSGVIKCGDAFGLFDHIYISGVLGTSELSTFATAFVPFTSAELLKLSYTQTDLVSLQGIGTGDFDIRTLGVVYFRDVSSPGKMIRFAYPCPNLNDFEHILQTGYRMKAERGNILAAMFSALTGKTLEFVEGSIT